MGRFPRSLAALFVAAGCAAVPASAETVTVAPNSPWNVNFGEESCRLGRLFGEGEDRHALFLEQFYPAASASMTAAGPGFRRFRSRARTRLRLFEAEEGRNGNPFSGEVEGVGDAMIYSSLSFDGGPPEGEDAESDKAGLPQLDAEWAKRIEFVSLKQGGKEVRLLTGPLGEAFEVLNLCAQGLVEEWGLDLEQHLSARRRPIWTNEDAVVRRIVDSYPSRALRRGEQAILRMVVMIDPEGAVTDCRILKVTETERLTSPACKAMERAEFEPALDAEGHPMPSYFATAITYVIR